MLKNRSKTFGRSLSAILAFTLATQPVLAQIGQISRADTEAAFTYLYEPSFILRTSNAFGVVSYRSQSFWNKMTSKFSKEVAKSPALPGYKEQIIDFNERFGDLNHRLTFSINDQTKLVPSIERLNNGQTGLVVTYTEPGAIYHGSRLVMPTPTDDLINVADDLNFIVALDKSGRLLALDRTQTKHHFGKERPLLFNIYEFELDKTKSYRLQFNAGPMSIAGIDISADLHGSTIQDGDLFLIEKDSVGKETLVEVVSRATLLKSYIRRNFAVAVEVAQRKPNAMAELQKIYSAIKGLDEDVIQLTKDSSEYGNLSDVEAMTAQIAKTLDARATVDGLAAVKVQIDLALRARSMTLDDFIQRSKITLSDAAKQTLLSAISKQPVSTQGLTDTEKWKASDLVKVGALVEFREKLIDWIADNKVSKENFPERWAAIKMAEEISHFLGNVERKDKDTRVFGAVDAAKTSADLEKIFTEMMKIAENHPRARLFDFIAAARGDESEDLQRYVNNALLVHPSDVGFLKKLRAKDSYKTVMGVVHSPLFFSIPTYIMAAGLTVMTAGVLAPDIFSGGATAQTLAEQAGSNQGVLHNAIPIMEQPAYLKQAIIASLYQWSIVIAILGASALTAGFKKADELKATVGKNIYAFFSMPFQLAIMKGIFKRKNLVYAANQGVNPFAAISNSDEKTEALIEKVAMIQNRRSYAERLSIYLVARSMGADEEFKNINVNDLNAEKIVSALHQFKKRSVKDALAQQKQLLDVIQTSVDPETIQALTQKLNELKRLQAQKLAEQDIIFQQYTRSAQVAIEGELKRANPDFDLNAQPDQLTAEICRLRGEAVVKSLSSNPEIIQWTRYVKDSVQKGLEVGLPKLSVFPLDIYESVTKGKVRADVARQNTSQWTVDIAIQIQLVIFWSGWPVSQYVEEHYGKRIPTRGDFYHQPEQLFAREGGFLNTHPTANGEIIDQHIVYATKGNAEALRELGAASSVKDAYERESQNDSENEESFMKSATQMPGALIDSIRYRQGAFFTNQFLNIGRFIQTTLILNYITRYFIAGEAFWDVPLQVLFAVAVSRWFYGWFWAPIRLPLAIRSEQLGAAHPVFVGMRETFETHLRTHNYDAARAMIVDIWEFYRAQGSKFAPSSLLKNKNVAQVTESDLNSIAAYLRAKPAVKAKVNRIFEESMMVVGGVVTTLLGIPFMIFTYMPGIDNYKVLFSLGGLAMFGLVNRAFWANRRVVLEKAVDPIASRWNTAKDTELIWSKDSYKLVATNSLQKHVQQESEAILNNPNLTAEQKQVASARLMKQAQEKMREIASTHATLQSSPKTFSRFARAVAKDCRQWVKKITKKIDREPLSNN